jgi:type I restriction-modification system DNA methylase subunit
MTGNALQNIENPPFNISDWGGKSRHHGVSPAGSANFAWRKHIVRGSAGSDHSGARITRRLGVA